MKQIIVYVKDKLGKCFWAEDYSIPDDVEPEKYARGLIQNFNNTLCPGELEREFIDVKVVEDTKISTFAHEWKKDNAYTQHNKKGYYDVMVCKACGMTGKRYRIGDVVTIDSKYKRVDKEHCRGVKK